MSRSNPTEESVHPCKRWLQWNGEKGEFKYFDKSLGDKGENVAVKAKMTFILLDELCTLKGWHDSSESGIYSNEVRNITTDKMVVKAFKGGTLGEGLYKDIKDKVKAQGAKFNINLYIAYKDAEGNLAIGSIMVQGAALNAWIEFKQEHGKACYEKSIKISGVAEGKKGKITFKTPIFELADISEASNEAAKQLDVTLQDHLKKYLSKNGTSTEGGANTEHIDKEVDEEVFSTDGNKKGEKKEDDFAKNEQDDLPF